MSDTKLTNEYVEHYYDNQVGALDTTYTDDRWHSSPVREFEYQQTLRALRQALSGRTYRRAVEIGPGDGVWTGVVSENITGSLHLVEQSTEMLEGAKRRLAGKENITFEHSDFQTSNPPQGNDLVVAIRCFEYFQDKEGALKKMRDLLAPGGRIVIITKNAELMTSQPVQHQTLHSDQLSRAQMESFAERAGLTVTRVYPAILRWKAALLPMRIIFDALQKIAVGTEGAVMVPGLTRRATESYVYVLRAR